MQPNSTGEHWDSTQIFRKRTVPSATIVTAVDAMKRH